MAKPVSEEELQLRKRARRRLIGAIALVAGTAAVLPMVLDSEPKPTSQNINIQIPPSEPKASVVPKGTPAAKVAPAAPAAKAETKAVEAPPAAKPEVAPSSEPREEFVAEANATKPPAAKPVPVEKGKDAEKDKDKAAASAAPKSGPGTFFIQVVALSEADKARQVQQQIAKAGISVYTESVTAGGSKVTRVRAGPFATREEAERARTKLQDMGFEGKVAAN
jgi:DedD protein